MYCSRRSIWAWIIRLRTLDHAHETAEEIPRIVRSRAVFRVVLDREHPQVGRGDAFHRAVVEVDVGHLHLALERFRVHREAVVLRGEVDLVADYVADRMIRAAVPELELVGAAAHGEGEDLVAEADAHHRDFAEVLAGLDVGAGDRGGIARAVAQHHPVRFAGEDLRRRRIRRHYGDAATDVDELSEDSSFDPVVDHDHFVLARLRLAALDALLPPVPFSGRDLAGEVLAFHARRLARSFDQRRGRRAGRVDHAHLRAARPKDADELAGIDALDADAVVFAQEIRQRQL